MVQRKRDSENSARQEDGFPQMAGFLGRQSINLILWLLKPVSYPTLSLRDSFCSMTGRCSTALMEAKVSVGDKCS